MTASQVQSAAERLATEIQQIEDQYGPGETARALIWSAMVGHDVDALIAAMFLLRPWTGPSTGGVR
jgi:hypothetical protein